MRESLLPLAESVADGSAVDWDEAVRHADPEDRALIRQLGVLAQLSELHRSLSDAPAAAAVPATSRRSHTAPAIGTWAHLTLLERLGGGTFGEVYRAWDRQLEREVALKLLRSVHGVGDDPETSRITREGRLLARVRHPNVITVHGVDVYEGRVGLWMELLRGQTLEQLLNSRGAFGAREAALVGIDLCRALAAIHSAGLLHRDVKAENVIREDGGRVVLMDLGTGREIDSSRRLGLPDFAGTPLYLPSEIFDGAQASEATDVYSLGILLYHLVTGSFPLWAKTVDELKRKHATSAPIRLRDARADLPTVFVAVVDCAIAKSPADRYLTAGALEADLLKSLDDETLAVTFIPPPAPEQRDNTLSKRRIAAISIVVAAIVASAALVAWPALRVRVNPPTAALDPIGSIAVLPLANLSGDPAQEYFADGMTDQLIGTLGQLRGVNVISRTSSMQFKGTTKTLPEIAQALHVDAVLEGSVLVLPGTRRDSAGEGSRLRINARLIRAGTDTQLWDRTFEAVADDVIKLQKQIAGAVAEGIHARLMPAPNAASGSAGQGVASFDAFDLYLKGRYYWNMRTPDALKQSVQYFQEAVGRGSVPAYAGLADAYNLLGVYGVLPAEDANRRARDAATKGLALDPSLAEAYASRGLVDYNEFNWAGAEADFKQAVMLAPWYATGHQWYAMYLAGEGRFDEATSEINKAFGLDPLSVGVNGQLAELFLLRRRYDEAIVHYRQTVAMDPAFARNRSALAEAFALKGDYAQALTELQATSATGNENAILLKEFGHVYAAAGRQAEAHKVIDELLGYERRHADGAAGALATVYASLGDRDSAFTWLDRSLKVHDPIFMRLKTDPRLDSLRGDPRYTKLLATAGLAQ